jgi:hypothetical protein
MSEGTSEEPAARMPRSVTSKRRRKIREQAETIAQLRAEIERLNTIIQVAMRQMLARTPTALMSHDAANGERK